MDDHAQQNSSRTRVTRAKALIKLAVFPVGLGGPLHSYELVETFIAEQRWTMLAKLARDAYFEAGEASAQDLREVEDWILERGI